MGTQQVPQPQWNDETLGQSEVERGAEMTVIIYCTEGEGFATWIDECGVEHEEYIGEVDDYWLENKAEEYFYKYLGEDISLEVIFEEDN
jgi:hypothetical protein